MTSQTFSGQIRYILGMKVSIINTFCVMLISFPLCPLFGFIYKCLPVVCQWCACFLSLVTFVQSSESMCLLESEFCSYVSVFSWVLVYEKV